MCKISLQNSPKVLGIHLSEQENANIKGTSRPPQENGDALYCNDFNKSLTIPPSSFIKKYIYCDISMGT